MMGFIIWAIHGYEIWVIYIWNHGLIRGMHIQVGYHGVLWITLITSKLAKAAWFSKFAKTLKQNQINVVPCANQKINWSWRNCMKNHLWWHGCEVWLWGCYTVDVIGHTNTWYIVHTCLLKLLWTCFQKHGRTAIVFIMVDVMISTPR